MNSSTSLDNTQQQEEKSVDLDRVRHNMVQHKQNGSRYLQDKLYSRAIASYEQALKLQEKLNPVPHFTAEIYWKLATCQSACQNIDSAIDSLLNSLKYYNTDSPVLDELDELSKEEKRQIIVEKINVHLDLATIYKNKHKFSKAKHQAEAANKLIQTLDNPSQEDIACQRRATEIIKDCESVLAIPPLTLTGRSPSNKENPSPTAIQILSDKKNDASSETTSVSPRSPLVRSSIFNDNYSDPLDGFQLGNSKAGQKELNKQTSLSTPSKTT